MNVSLIYFRNSNVDHLVKVVNAYSFNQGPHVGGGGAVMTTQGGGGAAFVRRSGDDWGRRVMVVRWGEGVY